MQPPFGAHSMPGLQQPRPGPQSEKPGSHFCAFAGVANMMPIAATANVARKNIVHPR
jgi:hypothetical protein